MWTQFPSPVLQALFIFYFQRCGKIWSWRAATECQDGLQHGSGDNVRDSVTGTDTQNSCMHVWGMCLAFWTHQTLAYPVSTFDRDLKKYVHIFWYLFYVVTLFQNVAEFKNEREWHKETKIAFLKKLWECLLLLSSVSFAFPFWFMWIQRYKTVILPVLCESETWSFTLQEKYSLSLFEKRVLWRIFGHKGWK